MSMNLDRIAPENIVCSWEEAMFSVPILVLKQLGDQTEPGGTSSLFFSLLHIKAGAKGQVNIVCLVDFR